MIEIDVDDHALSVCLLEFGKEKAQILASKAFPALGLQSWKTCLLDAIADTCVHHSRRDPRDCGSAEQMLYDQLDDVLEFTCQGPDGRSGDPLHELVPELDSAVPAGADVLRRDSARRAGRDTRRGH